MTELIKALRDRVPKGAMSTYWDGWNDALNAMSKSLREAQDARAPRSDVDVDATRDAQHDEEVEWAAPRSDEPEHCPECSGGLYCPGIAPAVRRRPMPETAAGPEITPMEGGGFMVADDTVRIAATGTTPAEAWESYRESVRLLGAPRSDDALRAAAEWWAERNFSMAAAGEMARRTRAALTPRDTPPDPNFPDKALTQKITDEFH